VILNAWTIASLFLSGLAACLALVLSTVSMRALLRRRHAPALEADEDSLHLLALLVVVLASIRFVAWPLFYGLLKSFVPEVASSGVMCAFGVTQLDTTLVGSLELIKPTTLLALGAWCSLSLASQRSGNDRLVAPLLICAVPLALLALADSATEIAYVLGERGTAAVTCCSQLLDTQAAGYTASSGALAALGSHSPATNLALFALSHIALLATLRLGLRPPPRTWLLATTAALGLANLALARWVWIDTVAPIVLQLPYHHCIYEVLTEVPVMALAAILTVFGNGALTWPLLLSPCSRRAPSEIAHVQRAIYKLCALALATSAIIVLTHAL
jgi:hypothetical protein